MFRTSNLLRVSTALSALSGWSWGGRKRPVQFSGPGTFWAMPWWTGRGGKGSQWLAGATGFECF